SSAIEQFGTERGISFRRMGKIARLDLAVDGADEVDEELRLIKGRGGALLREKIVAQASERFVVIVDDSKLVDRLGQGSLPVEVTPFAADRLIMLFDSMGIDPNPRLGSAGWFITDEGNRIIDVSVPGDRDVADLVREMNRWAGVVETGFFPDETTCVIVANEQGVRQIQRCE
ncbi:MAG: ribose 5-phosphate isomerase A, partial [Thermoanaerobaculia bacterium]|nr:ribose 5-phosphate isomerase A [Thermoanaerobaculia bacterium]